MIIFASSMMMTECECPNTFRWRSNQAETVHMEWQKAGALLAWIFVNAYRHGDK